MSRRLRDGHHEFLSDGWIEEARRFLRGAAPDAAFSFCEAFADPPPGIAGAWHVRVADGRVEAAAGEAAGTDLRVDGDYQAMLGMVQTVYAAGRDSLGRAHREMTHRHGPDAMRMSGTVPGPMQGVLAGLHDHMAARTVENPHLEHRVRRLGLADHAAELAGVGRTVVERAVTEAFADELADQVEAETAGRQTPYVGGLLPWHRLFEEIVLHPVARTAAETVLGPGLVLGSVRGGRVGAAGDPRNSPSSEASSPVVTASFVLDGAGAAPKGSLILTGSASSPPGPAPGLTLDITYARTTAARADDFGPVGTEQLRRNPPAFAALVGRGDSAGGSSAG